MLSCQARSAGKRAQLCHFGSLQVASCKLRSLQEHLQDCLAAPCVYLTRLMREPDTVHAICLSNPAASRKAARIELWLASSASWPSLPARAKGAQLIVVAFWGQNKAKNCEKTQSRLCCANNLDRREGTEISRREGEQALASSPMPVGQVERHCASLVLRVRAHKAPHERQKHATAWPPPLVVAFSPRSLAS